MLESSLHFCQASLKIFKQIKCSTGQLHSGLHEDNLIKKLKKRVAIPKSTRYYIELNKKAMEEESLKECSWINTKYLVLLSKFHWVMYRYHIEE